MKEGWRAKSAALAAVSSSDLATTRTILPLSTSRAHGGFSGSPSAETLAMSHALNAAAPSDVVTAASLRARLAWLCVALSCIDASRSDAYMYGTPPTSANE